MKDYFINQLEDGKKFNICFMLHNSAWYYLQKLDWQYENCSIDIYGRGMGSFMLKNKDSHLDGDYNYDLIIFDSSGKFSLDELVLMECLAINISNKKQKKVTLGFLYYLNDDERVEDSIQRFRIETFDGGNKVLNEDITIPRKVYGVDIYDMLDMVSQKHNEFERKFIKKITN